MNLRKIVWKEIWQRPSAMATSVVAILLGVAALVAIQHVNAFSEREVSRQLSLLGANILVLPNSASLQGYYSADMNGATLPEEDVSQIMLASLTGVERLSPKLSVVTQVDGVDVILTGILPQSEFKAKAAWQTASLVKKAHSGCKKVVCGPGEASTSPDSLTEQRTIENLAEEDVILGAEVAESLNFKTGDTIALFGRSFRVVATLSPTGTQDDSRVFAHLHRVQELSNSGPVVSAIEVMGCCEDAAGGLLTELRELLPHAKVVSISQVVATQVGVNQLMSSATALMTIVLVLVGGASVMGSISSNVRERRKEIGTLMALGATPRLTLSLFLMKATWLGVTGGVIGCLLGIAAALVAGPKLAGVAVSVLPDVALTACLSAIALALVAAYWPARQAASLDPCLCFREV